LAQEIAEQRRGVSFPPERRNLAAFFEACTGGWAACFASRAGVWMQMMQDLPAERAHAHQATIGPVSLLR